MKKPDVYGNSYLSGGGDLWDWTYIGSIFLNQVWRNHNLNKWQYFSGLQEYFLFHYFFCNIFLNVTIFLPWLQLRIVLVQSVSSIIQCSSSVQEITITNSWTMIYQAIGVLNDRRKYCCPQLHMVWQWFTAAHKESIVSPNEETLAHFYCT